MNSSINYPTFRYNNESLVLLPGSRFTKKELISRLHQMNIDSSNIQDKNSLVNLYESSLHNNLNKTKIIDKLRKDTEILNSKLGISQRQSLQASNMNTMSNNSKSKVINITTEVKPFTAINNNISNADNNANNNNIREINMKNRGEVTYNPLMSHNSNVQSNKTSRFGGYSNNDNNDNRNSYNDNYLNSGNFQNNNNNLSNNSSKRYTNTGNVYYNNQNESNYQNNFDNSMNTGMNNNNNNILNKSNMNNMNNNNDMHRSRAYNNNINNNSNTQYYAQGANTDINTSNSNRYNQVNNRNSNRYSNDSNNNYSVRPSQYQDESIFASGNNTNPYRSNNLNTTTCTANYAATNNNSVMNMNMNNNNQNRMGIDSQRQPVLSTGEERMQNNNNIRQREPDEESNFSIFSTFKNSPLFKDREEICKNLIISFIIIIFAIVTLSLAIKFWDSITNFFYEFFNMLLDPRRLIVDGIFGFISSLFFGSIHYFYITFPLIGIIIFLVIYIRKYNIKKNCEKIYKKMYRDLMDGQNNNEMNFIYEDDLYKKYAANYGISEKVFKRSYLPVLNRMRRRENKMKVSEQRDNNGKKVIFWHLNNN